MDSSLVSFVDSGIQMDARLHGHDGVMRLGQNPPIRASTNPRFSPSPQPLL